MKKNKNKKALIIVGVVGVLAVAGVAIYIYVKKKNTPVAEEAAEEEEVTIPNPTEAKKIPVAPKLPTAQRAAYTPTPSVYAPSVVPSASRRDANGEVAAAPSPGRRDAITTVGSGRGAARDAGSGRG